MRRAVALACLGLALCLSACAPPSAPPASLLTPLPPLPSVTATLAPLIPSPTASLGARTATAVISATPPAAAGTPTGTPTGRPGPVRRTATPGPACTNDAEFLADLTVPDGAQFLPGQTFTKKWSVRNTGTCDWGPSYRLVFVSGEALTAAPGVPGRTELALYPARAGALAVWEVSMRAPDAPGEYVGRWQARDPQGALFGGVVFIKIEVVPLPPTP
jgi:next-to-BRCA1 protein 1